MNLFLNGNRRSLHPIRTRCQARARDHLKPKQPVRSENLCIKCQDSTNRHLPSQLPGRIGVHWPVCRRSPGRRARAAAAAAAAAAETKHASRVRVILSKLSVVQMMMTSSESSFKLLGGHTPSHWHRGTAVVKSLLQNPRDS
jgi:hypothetical protein